MKVRKGQMTQVKCIESLHMCLLCTSTYMYIQTEEGDKQPQLYSVQNLSPDYVGHNVTIQSSSIRALWKGKCCLTIDAHSCANCYC